MHQSTLNISFTVRAAELRNGVVVEYVDQGDASGLPIVFLHGVTDSWRSFEAVLARLPASIRALALSQRGHGESSRPASGYRFVDFSDDLREFLDALDIPAALIVGHSMGSYVALRFALDHPSRTLGLVLMGAFPTIRGNRGVQELWDTRVSSLADPVDPEFVVDFQRSTLARPIDPTSLDTFVRESLKVPAHVWRATFEEFLTADFSQELKRITAPTLIAWGDEDAFFPLRDQVALRDSIRGSQLVVYHGAGHAFHWEKPTRFVSHLLRFAASGTTKQRSQRFPSVSSVRGGVTSTTRSTGVTPLKARAVY
jgi:non-heme chloroperoxidase